MDIQYIKRANLFNNHIRDIGLYHESISTKRIGMTFYHSDSFVLMGYDLKKNYGYTFYIISINYSQYLDEDEKINYYFNGFLLDGQIKNFEDKFFFDWPLNNILYKKIGIEKKYLNHPLIY